MIEVEIECTLKVKVIIPEKIRKSYIEDGKLDKSYLIFYFEENSCPGTGLVGSAIEKVFEEHEANSTCWACALQGENKILKVIIDGKEENIR